MNRIETLRTTLTDTLAAIDAFTASPAAGEVDAIYRQHLKLFRLYLGDILDSLGEDGIDNPAPDHDMGYPIVDMWPRGKEGEHSELVRLGDMVLKAENAYRKALQRRR